VILRKAAGSEDISGDYNVYGETKSVGVGDRDVTMKGNGGTVSLALWTEEGYTYAVTSDAGMSPEAMENIVSQTA